MPKVYASACGVLFCRGKRVVVIDLLSKWFSLSGIIQDTSPDGKVCIKFTDPDGSSFSVWFYTNQVAVAIKAHG